MLALPRCGVAGGTLVVLYSGGDDAVFGFLYSTGCDTWPAVDLPDVPDPLVKGSDDAQDVWMYRRVGLCLCRYVVVRLVLAALLVDPLAFSNVFSKIDKWTGVVETENMAGITRGDAFMAVLGVCFSKAHIILSLCWRLFMRLSSARDT